MDVPQTHSFTSEENRGACQLSSCHSGLVSGSERCDFARATTKAGNRQGCRHTLRLLPCSPSTLLLSSHRFATLNAPRESSRAASDYQLLQQRQPACPHLQVLPLVPLTDVQVGPLSTLLCHTQAQQVLCSRVWAVGHRGAGVGDTPVPSVSKGTGDRVSGMHLYRGHGRKTSGPSPLCVPCAGGDVLGAPLPRSQVVSPPGKARRKLSCPPRLGLAAPRLLGIDALD